MERGTDSLIGCLRHGRGFCRSNLNYMSLFYLLFPICETLSHKLSWSHNCELVIIEMLEKEYNPPMPPKTLQIRHSTAEFLILTKQAGENGMEFQCAGLRQSLPQRILQYPGQA